MKTKLFLLGMLLTSLFLVSCSDDDDFEIHDYATYNATFTVTRTADNADLLADSVFLSKTYVEHRDKKYAVIKLGDAGYAYPNDVIQSRYLLPKPWALRLFKTEDGQYVLRFGEFGPVENYKDETFTIHWADGTSNIVSFNLYLKGDDVRKNSKLDGKETDFLNFDIKK